MKDSQFMHVVSNQMLSFSVFLDINLQSCWWSNWSTGICPCRKIESEWTERYLPLESYDHFKIATLKKHFFLSPSFCHFTLSHSFSALAIHLFNLPCCFYLLPLSLPLFAASILIAHVFASAAPAYWSSTHKLVCTHILTYMNVPFFCPQEKKCLSLKTLWRRPTLPTYFS